MSFTFTINPTKKVFGRLTDVITNWPHKQCIKYLNTSLKISKWHMVVQGDSSEENKGPLCFVCASVALQFIL